jgi:hypothetical protein
VLWNSHDQYSYIQDLDNSPDVIAQAESPFLIGSAKYGTGTHQSKMMLISK